MGCLWPCDLLKSDETEDQSDKPFIFTVFCASCFVSLLFPRRKRPSNAASGKEGLCSRGMERWRRRDDGHSLNREISPGTQWRVAADLTNRIPSISQKPALEPGLHDSADQFFCLPANPTGLVYWLGDFFSCKEREVEVRGKDALTG